MGVILRAVWASCCSVHPQNKEPSVGILLEPELGLARRGERHFQVLLHIHDIFNTLRDIYIFCLPLFLCFYNADPPARDDRPRVIIQAVIESRWFVPISRSPVVAPSLFGCFSFLSSSSSFFCLPLFSFVSSNPHCGDLSALTCQRWLPHGQGQRLIKLVPIVSILQISLSQQV